MATEDDDDVTDAQIDAILADPTFARIVAKAVKPYERILTEKGLDRARRTVATVFLTDPHAASLLARAREAGPPDATTRKGGDLENLKPFAVKVRAVRKALRKPST